jgi:DNA-binding FadR family transcriptional regulator
VSDPDAERFRPLIPARSLAEALSARLRDEIREGRLTPADRLPTEQALMESFGVSRTVVREAIAALRAEGLVETRQGLGAFVSIDPRRRPFRIDPGEVGSIGDVVKIMELRTAVEVEAAGFAALNRSAAQVERLAGVLAEIDAEIEAGGAAADQDFAFHCAIAEATGNEYFLEFLAYLGRFIIPRQVVRIGITDPTERRLYLGRVQAEHRRIFEAIRDAEAGKARAAMRQHLENSRARYRRLAEELAAP